MFPPQRPFALAAWLDETRPISPCPFVLSAFPTSALRSQACLSLLALCHVPFERCPAGQSCRFLCVSAAFDILLFGSVIKSERRRFSSGCYLSGHISIFAMGYSPDI